LFNQPFLTNSACEFYSKIENMSQHKWLLMAAQDMICFVVALLLRI